MTGELCCDPGQVRFDLTDGGNVHVGSAAPECVFAGAGGDFVYAFGGNDFVAGQEDADVLFGGDDADVLVCNGGEDVAYGGAGPDLVTGGDGHDVLIGDGGDDDLDGGAGDDVLYGNAGDDELRGRAGDDVLAGGTGPDRLYPGSGVDIAYGDGSDDEVYLLHTCELTSAQVAVAWLRSRGYGLIPIVGARKVQQIEDCIGGAALELNPDELAALEEISAPPNPGFPHDALDTEHFKDMIYGEHARKRLDARDARP